MRLNLRARTQRGHRHDQTGVQDSRQHADDHRDDESRDLGAHQKGDDQADAGTAQYKDQGGGQKERQVTPKGDFEPLSGDDPQDDGVGERDRHIREQLACKKTEP